MRHRLAGVIYDLYTPPQQFSCPKSRDSTARSTYTNGVRKEGLLCCALKELICPP